MEFSTQQLMETFCTEHLITQGLAIEFRPSKVKKEQTRDNLMDVSFLNIPLETPKELVTDFLNTYADTRGTPLYIKKNHDGVEYCTGTRIYEVTGIYQHIPRYLPNMFGRTILCIYDAQPEQIENQK